MKKQKAQQIERTLSRQRFILGLVSAGFLVLAAKLVTIQLLGHDRLVAEAKARHVRTVKTAAIRGPIFDRDNRLLAVSTPVDTVWAEAKFFCEAQDQWPPLTKLLSLPSAKLKQQCAQRSAKEYKNNFLYIKRQISPLLAEEAKDLGIKGVHLERDYKRFYPAGPAAGHLIGFTDIDGNGQEGLEKAYNASLVGHKGEQVVHRDSKGRFVEFVEQVAAVENGAPLVLSIDSRIQTLASGYLEEAVRTHKARGGSVVVIHAATGEILAMVDSPQFNPNDRRTLLPKLFRNRAVTDVQEPGSTVKPFTIAAALETGDFTPESVIDTGKGRFKVPGGKITDTHEHGVISLAQIVVKSSNVGAAKLSMEFPYEDLYNTLGKVGFGQKVNAVPAEVSGVLPKRKILIDRLTQSYGYGLNATPLQIARSYTVFANGGVMKPITILKQAENANISGKRVFSKKTTAQVLAMLEDVATPEGTARRARVTRYRVGGKTGTSRRNTGNGYEKDHYVSWFVGLAPISDPQFVMAVMVDDPQAGKYYGGTVAGPVFSKTMQDILRLYNVSPDAVPNDSVNSSMADGKQGKARGQI
ncbi:MAG: penicillin-binding protein 2 [Arenicellales bacterium]